MTSQTTLAFLKNYLETKFEQKFNYQIIENTKFTNIIVSDDQSQIYIPICSSLPFLTSQLSKELIQLKSTFILQNQSIYMLFYTKKLKIFSYKYEGKL